MRLAYEYYGPSITRTDRLVCANIDRYTAHPDWATTCMYECTHPPVELLLSRCLPSSAWGCMARSDAKQGISRNHSPVLFLRLVAYNEGKDFTAEALIRWGGKIKWRLTAYFLSNIYAKNYQNWLMYVEVVASQSSDVVLETPCTYW